MVVAIGCLVSAPALAEGRADAPVPGDEIPNGAPGEALLIQQMGIVHRGPNGDADIAITHESSVPYPRIVDMDGDGVLDLVANWGWDGGHTLELFIWREGEYLSVPWDAPVEEGGQNVGPPALLDVDSDGDLDVLFGDGESGTLLPGLTSVPPIDYALPRLIVFDAGQLTLERASLACAGQIRDLTVSLLRTQASQIGWRWADAPDQAEAAADYLRAADMLEAEACPPSSE